jgi:hypothetical protein
LALPTEVRNIVARIGCHSNAKPSIQIALLDHDVFSNDQPMGGHLAQARQDAANMFVGIHERENDRQLASGFDQVSGTDAAPSEKSRDGMKGNRAEDIFFAQILQQLKM